MTMDRERLAELEKIAREVTTPGDIDSAPESGPYGSKERDQWLECPACNGEGSVDGATYSNFDAKPLGVQFFGIGAEPEQWEAYFRAFRPEVALALLSDLTAMREENERLRGALEDVVNPMGSLQRHAEARGSQLNGLAYSIANNLGFVQSIARQALGSSHAS